VADLSHPTDLAHRIAPPGFGSGFYKDTVDYSIFCGEWCIGRIYETCTGPESLRWFWALHAPSKPGTMRISNQVATLADVTWSPLGEAGIEPNLQSFIESQPKWDAPLLGMPPVLRKRLLQRQWRPAGPRPSLWRQQVETVHCALNPGR
jgi:hypothetical protein